MSSSLLSRQGPLAHVWLASNYDKKLSKHQLLNTNIVTSSKILSSKQLQSSNISGGTENTITLRLSGQLLLGIVRIYSRKTKYLLDDINETLYKLKNSFKYASGATLGSGPVSTVNLPPQQTTLSNFSRTLLEDQVTDLDLFYQEDLRLDEPEQMITADTFSSEVNSFNRPEGAPEYDQSVEIARGAEDMDLDFDLDLDHSIEHGRDAQMPMSEGDTSVVDLPGKDSSVLEGMESALDFDLDLPLETIEERQETAEASETAPVRTELTTRRRLVGVMEDGVIKTTKRRLVVDEEDELERGLPNNVLKSIQHLQAHGGFTGEMIELKLSESEKMSLIYELAETSSIKKRKIWNSDELLRQTCDALADAEHEGHSPNMDFSFDNNMDFDLSLPGLESSGEPQSEDDNDIENDDQNGIENVKGTIQVAEHLRNTFYENPTVTLDELMRKDIQNPDNTPLGAIKKTETGFKISKRREATKCFFELLVLASQDCVSLEQDETTSVTHLGSDLTIRPRDKLISTFV
ncbi:hypothetical protein CLUG_03478 [Clavispora lusitaniae ATCC 42720]|uniref:Cohesin subunit n=1 Tax=Clavispora lusitaniae (strain ATCC 42720) TaxID=306902 RepID=C4Y5P4_CLAL4|nr:uncharacterized protein CLUG_03478 [Clavispora lusitaniae ATCC 42720]EEQ39350.1 hypothetical protein CLUG_03478 [Clavispora lusitaniae ATCC 42720]